MPFGIAYVIYWAPVWISHSTNVADYSAWAPIFYGSWGLPGVIASLVGVYVIGRRRKSKQK